MLPAAIEALLHHATTRGGMAVEWRALNPLQ